MIRDFYDIDLSGRNSFHVRQRAARLVEFETTDDLTAFFRKGAPAKWTVLAGGNNILFTQDFDGVLLTPRAASIDVVAETPDAVAVRAEAGVEWDDLVAWAVATCGASRTSRSSRARSGRRRCRTSGLTAQRRKMRSRASRCFARIHATR